MNKNLDIIEKQSLEILYMTNDIQSLMKNLRNLIQGNFDEVYTLVEIITSYIDEASNLADKHNYEITKIKYGI